MWWLSLLVALVGTSIAYHAMVAHAAPNLTDRMQLHRNPNRGLPYLPLAQTGAAHSSATISMRVALKIELDGTALNNVRGNVYPIDVDGDGRFEFIHFNGYRFMRAYDRTGRKLWQIDNPSGRVHRDMMHRDTLAPRPRR